MNKVKGFIFSILAITFVAINSGLFPISISEELPHSNLEDYIAASEELEYLMDRAHLSYIDKGGVRVYLFCKGEDVINQSTWVWQFGNIRFEGVRCNAV